MHAVLAAFANIWCSPEENTGRRLRRVLFGGCSQLVFLLGLPC